MKKILLFLLVGIFMFGMVSALEFDNGIKYKDNDMNVSFENGYFFGIGEWFGLSEEIGTAELKSHKSVNEILSVAPGKDIVTMYYDFNFKEIYTGGLGEVEFVDMYSGEYIERDYHFVIWDKRHEEVNNYSVECSDVYSEVNNSYYEVCENILIGTYIKETGSWVRLDTNDIPNGKVRVGLATDVEIGDNLDGIWTIAGRKVDKHAQWTANLNIGLVSYYRCDEDASNTTVVDSHGSNTGVAFQDTSLFSSAGIIDTGFKFDAEEEYVGVASGGSSPFDFPGNFSVSFWINATSLTTANILGNWQLNTNEGGWRLYMLSDGSLSYHEEHSGTSLQVKTAAGFLGTGSWQHVIFQKIGTTGYFYVDDVETSSYQTRQTLHNAINASTQQWQLGRQTAHTLDYTLDEVGLWNRTLNSDERSLLYDSGNGSSYIENPNAIIILLNSPEDDYGQVTNNITFNATVDATGALSVINVSLIINGIINETNSSGIPGDYIFEKNLPEGNHIWNIRVTDNNSEVTSSENRTLGIDIVYPQISIESPTGILDYNYIGNNETLNMTFTDTNLDSCWYNYNGTNISIEGCITGIKNSTDFILESGNTNITIYANDTFGSSNQTYINWSYTYLENNRTHNNESFETASESFNINIEGATSAVLVYSGTEYTSTKSGNSFNTTIQVPLENLGSRSVYWRFDDTQNSYESYQNVSETVFTLCNSTYTEDFLNISFKDEADLSILNASIPTSTFEYYLGDGTLTKSYTYVEPSDNYNYKFCATPSNRSLHVLPYVQFKQGTTYPQRIWEPAVQTYNNTLTSQVLYLLSSVDGLYVTFQVINSANQVISGVDVTAIREISSQDVTVGAGTTGDSGTVTFWLNPDFSHDFAFSKAGLTTYESSFSPTQTSYTITMGGETTAQNSSTRGVSYSIIPTNTFLENDTEYTFGFNLNSSFWDIDEYGFNLRLVDGTIIQGDSTGTEGTQLTKQYNVNNQSKIYLDAYWLVNGNYTNFTRYWAVQNTEYTEYSIATFFEDLNIYIDSGLFGLDDFGRYLIAFIIVFISVGLMGYKFRVSSPLGIITLTFGIVFFLDVVTGLIPTINGINHLPTFMAGLILALALFNEVRIR